ncbi:MULTISPECIES: hypothetical protein [Shewanella]|jgi:hypothetical protein|uniref:hypothetical protein n=1 Tax=Shewanella TaxID=22 RepID=UPI0005628958|nr:MULTISPECIES: hypothetical protein [Shewanella]ASF14982.1 hypothetical protein CEQ32_08205 [Shewanella sp. FDAARGOS_354]MBW0297358.1 hypothetical protein [Shewanella xiamenensis]MCT8857832.1 hypothetical protein [Shewanella xiamenensis]PWH04840.1 hypothetical protein DIY08_00940 [Shewanella xiamenensis]QQK60757.1 hypothetical protein FJD32_015455 [Shewanella sp. LC6]
MLVPSSNSYFVSEIEAFSSDPVSLIGFVIAAVIFIVAYKYTPFIKHLSETVNLRPSTIFVLSFSFILIGFFATLSTYLDIYQVQQSVLENKTQLISGCIKDHQVNQSASREESFSVSGVRFAYNDYVTASYFFSNKNHESFIRNGQCVSILYLPNFKNGILKIDKL